MELYQDFPNICRLCLQSGDLSNFFQIKLKKLFEMITNIEINGNDVLPKKICKICLNQLEEISAFVDKCKTNDTLLKKISINIKISNECDEFNDTEFDADSNTNDNDTTFRSQLINQESSALPDMLTDNNSNLHQSSSKGPNTKYCTNCKKNITRDELKKHYRLNAKCRPKDCKCPVCDKSFYPRYKLTIHLQSHKKNTLYECPECLKKFTFAERLRKHVSTHKGVKPFICQLCEKGFLRKRSLDEHMNFHTGSTPYMCVYCGKAFKRFTDHASHIYHMHDENTEKIPKHRRKYTEKRVHLNIECKICKKIFASRSGYANHQLIHKGVKKFLCNVCGKKFITNPILRRHMRTHTGEKPFDCKQCGRSFTQRYSLDTHMSQHLTDKSLSCPNCDKRYYTKTGLANHIQLHTDENSVHCPLCNKTFTVKQLHNHLPRHEKRHKCNLCDKTFISASHLNDHMTKHTGEKRFLCLVCGKHLAKPQTLKVHMRQHTGEKPYVCSVCQKGYHDSTNLRRHFKRHHESSEKVKKEIVVANNDETNRTGDMKN